MNNFYHKGCYVSVSQSDNHWLVSIKQGDQTHNLDCVPQNSDSLDAGRFAKEFIETVLLNNK